MIQNHMLQLLCLVAMEPPVTFDADPVRDEKAKVLRALRPIAADEVDRVAVRGQYGPGFVGGQRVPGYREEKGVSADSITETYAALRLDIDNWRWAGVPFYLRTGKRLPKRASEIAVQFKQHAAPPVPPQSRRSSPSPTCSCSASSPTRASRSRSGPSCRAPSLRIKPVEMDFDYGKAFGGEPPEAYERLLLDAMKGDATLYARGDWVDDGLGAAAARARQPGPTGDPRKFPNYEAGTWGPAEADTLIERSGRRWRRP